MAFRSKLISSGKLALNRTSLFSKSLVVSVNNSHNLSLSAAANATDKSSDNNKDQETHTGQAFDKDDYRLVRFTNRTKEVNTRFAIDLIDQVPPKPAEERVVWCDGGGGATGHPRVYINLDPQGNHICGYCGLRFFKDGSKHH